ATGLGVFLRIVDEALGGIDADNLTGSHGRLKRGGERSGPGAHVEDTIAVLDSGKCDVRWRQQTAPTAHETLVVSAHREHLCLGLRHLGVFLCSSNYVLTKECSNR